MATAAQIVPGLYVHYKGGIYTVLGVADDGDQPDDGKPLVVYRSTAGRLFYRSLSNFTQIVSPRTGFPSPVGIHRFQPVVGWEDGRPLVVDYPEIRNGLPVRTSIPRPFVPEWEDAGPRDPGPP